MQTSTHILESPYRYWSLRTIIDRTVSDTDGRMPLDTIPLPDSPNVLRAPALDLLQKHEASEAEGAERAHHIAVGCETSSTLGKHLSKLQRRRFGRRSEKLSPKQISFRKEA